MGIKRAPHGENNRALQSRRGVRAGEEAAAQGERQGPTAGPVLGAYKGIPIAHSRDFRYNQTEVTKPKTTGANTGFQVL